MTRISGNFTWIFDCCCRYIVTDCDSIDVYFKNQHYTKTPEEAAAKAILAGDYTLQIVHNVIEHSD